MPCASSLSSSFIGSYGDLKNRNSTHALRTLTLITSEDETNNNWNRSGMQTVGTFLESCQSLEHVAIDGMDEIVQTDEGESLAHGLLFNESICSLSLRHCGVGDKVVKTIRNMSSALINRKAALEYLKVDFESEVVGLLLDLIKHQKIQGIEIQTCYGIYPDQVDAHWPALCDAIAFSPPTLRTLILTVHHELFHSEHHIQRFLEALELNTSLTYLAFESGAHYVHNLFAAFLKTVPRLPHIKHLRVTAFDVLDVAQGRELRAEISQIEETFVQDMRQSANSSLETFDSDLFSDSTVVKLKRIPGKQFEIIDSSCY